MLVRRACDRARITEGGRRGVAAGYRHAARVAAIDVDGAAEGVAVAGLRGIHLQCHIGTDTVSLARLGARMTGLDFSAPALAQARRLATAARADVDFVESELYALTERGGVATARLEEVVAEQRSAATAGVGEQEYAVTVATLRTIAGNLGAAESS